MHHKEASINAFICWKYIQFFWLIKKLCSTIVPLFTETSHSMFFNFSRENKENEKFISRN